MDQGKKPASGQDQSSEHKRDQQGGQQHQPGQHQQSQPDKGNDKQPNESGQGKNQSTAGSTEAEHLLALFPTCEWGFSL